MILGYEQPVDIPVQSIYDKPMMQMYLQALLKDYEQGVAEQKEFLSNFGNFTSPIAADIDAWNARTIDPIREYLDRNPNALRSVEGRNLLSKFIATRPYGDLAKLRQSAENARSYKQLLAQGIANGTLDPRIAEELDKNPNNWNTLEQGMWDKLAPTSQKTAMEVLAPYIKDLQEHGYDFDPITSKQRPGYRAETVSEDKIKDVFTKNGFDIMKDPMMKYRAKQLGLSDEDYINNQLVGYAKDVLRPKWSIDEYEKEKYGSDLSLRNQLTVMREQDKISQRNAERDQQYKLEQIREKNNKNRKEGTTSSLHFNVYQQGNLKNGTVDVTEEDIQKKALEYTDKKFAKYKKNGLMPASVRNSKAYKKAYEHNVKAVMNEFKIQRQKTESSVIANSKEKNSSALAITVSDTQVHRLHGLAQQSNLKDGELTGTYDVPGNEIYTISEITNKRTNVVYKHSRKNSTKTYTITPSKYKNNLIQQTEPDGAVHRYLKLSDGKYYHLGVYDPLTDDMLYSDQDQKYLNDVDVKTKAVETAIGTTAEEDTKS